MIILAVRTDKPEAELYIYEGQSKIAEIVWEAHRQLAETIHKQIDKLLKKSGISMSDIAGIVLFKGPGSFTGLRIGASIANALAYSLEIPIVSTDGKNWVEKGISQLQAGKSEKIAIPNYGRPPHTTHPKK